MLLPVWDATEHSCVRRLIPSFELRLASSCRASWLTFPLQVANAPPGTQACTKDIAKFHRTCPVLPDHKPFLVFQGDYLRSGAFSSSNNLLIRRPGGLLHRAHFPVWCCIC